MNQIVNTFTITALRVIVLIIILFATFSLLDSLDNDNSKKLENQKQLQNMFDKKQRDHRIKMDKLMNY